MNLLDLLEETKNNEKWFRATYPNGKVTEMFVRTESQLKCEERFYNRIGCKFERIEKW